MPYIRSLDRAWFGSWPTAGTAGQARRTSAWPFARRFRGSQDNQVIMLATSRAGAGDRRGGARGRRRSNHGRVDRASDWRRVETRRTPAVGQAAWRRPKVWTGVAGRRPVSGAGVTPNRCAADPTRLRSVRPRGVSGGSRGRRTRCRGPTPRAAPPKGPTAEARFLAGSG